MSKRVPIAFLILFLNAAPLTQAGLEDVLVLPSAFTCGGQLQGVSYAQKALNFWNKALPWLRFYQTPLIGPAIRGLKNIVGYNHFENGLNHFREVSLAEQVKAAQTAFRSAFIPIDIDEAAQILFDQISERQAQGETIDFVQGINIADELTEQLARFPGPIKGASAKLLDLLRDSEYSSGVIAIMQLYSQTFQLNGLTAITIVSKRPQLLNWLSPYILDWPASSGYQDLELRQGFTEVILKINKYHRKRGWAGVDREKRIAIYRLSEFLIRDRFRSALLKMHDLRDFVHRKIDPFLRNWVSPVFADPKFAVDRIQEKIREAELAIDGKTIFQTDLKSDEVIRYLSLMEDGPKTTNPLFPEAFVIDRDFYWLFSMGEMANSQSKLAYLFVALNFEIDRILAKSRLPFISDESTRRMSEFY